VGCDRCGGRLPLCYWWPDGETLQHVCRDCMERLLSYEASHEYRKEMWEKLFSSLLSDAEFMPRRSLK
jgi:hypothetical protein